MTTPLNLNYKHFIAMDKAIAKILQKKPEKITVCWNGEKEKDEFGESLIMQIKIRLN